MEKWILIFMCLFINEMTCNAQKIKDSKNSIKNSRMIIPNRNIRNIEIPNLEQIYNQFTKKDSINTKSPSGINIKLNRVTKNSINDSNYSFEEYDSKGLVRRMFIENSRLYSLEEIYRNENNVILIHKDSDNYKNRSINIDVKYNYVFYDTGELKKIKTYSDNIPVGNWYVYDKSGNEISNVNIEKHFRMSVLQVLEIASKIEIDNLPSYSIARLFDKSHSYWKLEYFQLDGGVSRIFLLDDSNGKTIYNELKTHEPDYRNSGIIDYNSIIEYMRDIFEPFE